MGGIQSDISHGNSRACLPTYRKVELGSHENFVEVSLHGELPPVLFHGLLGLLDAPFTVNSDHWPVTVGQCGLRQRLRMRLNIETYLKRGLAGFVEFAEQVLCKGLPHTAAHERQLNRRTS